MPDGADQLTVINECVFRRRGLLTFDDVQFLLTPGNRASGGALISRRSDEAARLYIDYRLDCRLDHWLLDEFQDTSNLQWEVLRNLADEIIQDDSGTRTLFYVGDVKQAIHGWRGGNARLFQDILDRYGPRIRQEHLSESHRSAKPVINLVNRVFSDVSEVGIGDDVVAAWRRAWQEHRVASRIEQPDAGYATFLELPAQEGGEKPGAADRYRLVGLLLNRIRPLDRGLSAAVLVRTNDEVRAAADTLRDTCPGLDVVEEGRSPIVGNPVAAVLLSLLAWAAHPGDRLAWRHLQMSPLAAALGPAERHRDAHRRLLRQLQEEGLAATLRAWGALLDTAVPLDAFGRRRLDDLLEAAGLYEDGGNRDADGFLDFMEHYQLHQVGAGRAVRVMTIHQSKGLGFDIVFVPDLQAHQGIDKPRMRNYLLHTDAGTGRAAWTLQAPRAGILQLDGVLSACRETECGASVFEALCVLYVAMTRARRGLYLLASAPGPTSTALSHAAFVRKRLDPNPRIRTVEGVTVHEYGHVGNEQWYATYPEVAASPTAESESLPARLRKRKAKRSRLIRVNPSRRAEQPRDAALLFAPATRTSLELGTAVHALFEQVDWLSETDTGAVVERWMAATDAPGPVKREAVEHFRRAAAEAEIRAALARPDANAEVWRGRSFELVRKDEWVTGTFDRVVVRRDAGGRAVSAEIQDFKTNAVSPAEDLRETAEGYRPQLDLYREAVARMLDLPTGQVSASLLFTHCGRRIAL